ncbi:hypothetical protein IWW34DRAFT_824344 [Fusarium oxysporum f. sp. albedinis]|nr:hypothetical protein IWW34DRAFT_824344 [Fusarium oxysporum f. sp. albedinis]
MWNEGVQILMKYTAQSIMQSPTLFAIGHHLFYLNLDGKEAISQSLMLRYGTVIAFCSKASLGTAVTMAFHQRAWRVVRYKTARLKTIDSIFTANSDIFSLVTWGSIKKAKIGTLLAIYCWEEIYWRDPWRINDQNLFSMSGWYITGDSRESPANHTLSDFDYFARPSPPCEMLIANKPVLMGKAIIRKESASEICAEGWNCSYVVDFVAPGYKCQELASGVNSEVKKLGDATAPFNTSIIAPMGNFTYYAITDEGEYGDPQMISNPIGIPKQKPPYPDNFGAFRTEPIIWIGYATVDNLSVPQPDTPGEGDWNKAYTPFNYTGGVQSFDIKRQDYLRRVVNTTYIPRKDPDERLKDRTQAVPESNYILPIDVKAYHRTAAYHSIGYGMRGFLNGTIERPSLIVKTDLINTHLITQVNYLPIKNLRQGIQRLYEDMIISIFAEPNFSVVSWAANGKPSGHAKGGPSTAYPCRRQRIATFFDYNMAQLLSVYAVSIFLAVVGILLGLQAYREEGAMRDMKPSSIIEASRASNLHTLGAHQGGNVKLGYGVVHEEAGRSIRSFGVEGNVQQ